MKRSCLGLAAMLALTSVGAASAQSSPSANRPPATCIPPPPPPPQSSRPPSPGPKPALPACVTLLGGTQGCRRGEVDRYNGEIQAFNARVEASNESARRYVAALNGWTEAVSRYAHCEIDAVNDQVSPGG
jgi:hypothetical protein